MRVDKATRRQFLGGVFSTGALVLGAQVAGAWPRFDRSMASSPAQRDAEKAAWHPNVYLGLETDGSVIIVAHRSEMGTGVRTALPMIVADEMEADWARVRVEQALGDEKYGSQDTDGSASVRDFYEPLRQAGATARLMLERAAAAKWGVDAGECKAENHRVLHRSTQRALGFGELAVLAAKEPLPHPDEVRLKSESEFRYIGKGVAGIDLHAICTGRAEYGFDVQVPGMIYASIERAPVLGGKLKTFDDAAARQVSGVEQTIVIESAKPPYGFQALGGVAVLAKNTWAAAEGRRKLKAEWEDGPHAIFQTDSYKRMLLERAREPQKVVRRAGNVETAFAKEGKTVEASYYTPLLAHASMEPPAALADFRDGKVEVWAATQDPQQVQKTVAAALGLKSADVKCHVTLLGGAFGRKSKPDYVAEAAILSKKTGKPVKIAWTREEDLHFDYYHSTSGMYFKAVLDEKGRPEAWLQRSVFPPIGSTFDGKSTYASAGEMGLGFIDVPFDVPNLQAENGPAEAHLRIGWLRSVSNVYHAFGIQSFIAECAAAAGATDAAEYWLQVLGAPRKIDLKAEQADYPNYGKPIEQFPVDTGRLRRVAEIALERSGWANRKSGSGRGFGFAAHRSFLTYAAAVVEVEVDAQGGVHIPRVDMAVDCGRVIHPDRVKAQFEGASVFGAGIALLGEITAADGRVQQQNFNTYRVPRMNEAPRETHVYLTPSDAAPTGVGEPGVPPMAPAICNAIFAATGKRVRELPVKKALLT